MASVVVAGALASKYRNGGEAWVRLSWLDAFRRLGFDVWFVEQVPDPGPGSGPPPADLVRWFAGVTGESGLAGRSWLASESGVWFGPPAGRLEELAGGAEMVLNISGNLTLPLLDRFRRRVFLDIDPGFTQFWHERGLLGDELERHSHHFTIGGNIGRPGCPIPTGGLRWRPTTQPVVLDEWPETPSDSCARLTTVGSLRGPYGRVERAGRAFGLKIHEMRRFAALPRIVRPRMELAFRIDPGDRADRERLARCGWGLTDPDAVAADPHAFRRYVQGSDGEFSVAQGIYAETASGWFSDRTVRYLASGKPAVVQDTGAADLPAGEGLLTFRTLPEAAAAVEAVTADYDRHRKAARRLAEERFEATRVASAMAEDVGVSP